MSLFKIALHKSSNKSLLEQDSGWSQCWETNIPGIPTISAISSDNKYFGIIYKVITDEGIKQRLRLYSSFSCSNKIPYNASITYYNDLSSRFNEKGSVFSTFYDDVPIPSSSDVSALAISRNIMVYSTYYDKQKFHIIKDWAETFSKEVDYPPANRSSFVLYESCYKLHIIEKEYSTLLLAFLKVGESHDELQKVLTIYDIQNYINDDKNPDKDLDSREPLHRLIKMNSYYHLSQGSSASFLAQDFEFPMKYDSTFRLFDKESFKFVYEDEDEMIIGEQQFNSVSSTSLDVFQKYSNVKYVTATDDYSVIAFYSINCSKLIFYNTKAKSIRYLFLDDLPKYVRNIPIINMILVTSFWDNDIIKLFILFKGGTLLEAKFERKELLKESSKKFIIGFVSLSIIVVIVIVRVGRHISSRRYRRANVN